MKQQENLQEGKGLTRVHIHLCLFLILSEWFFYSKSVEKTPGVMGCCMSRPGQAVDLLLCAFVQITSKALENDLQYAIGNVAGLLVQVQSHATSSDSDTSKEQNCRKIRKDKRRQQCMVTTCSIIQCLVDLLDASPVLLVLLPYWTV